MHVTIPEEFQDRAIAYVTSNYAKKITAAAMNLIAVTYEESSLSWRESEAARRRTAEINGCSICLNWRPGRDLPGFYAYYGKQAERHLADRAADMPDEAFYENISNWRNVSLYSERERLTIEYAELMGLNPQGVPYEGEFWDRMKASFSDEEIVDLSYCLACWIGMGRTTHALGIGTTCAFEPQSTQLAAE